jgi:hypothetical protein
MDSILEKSARNVGMRFGWHHQADCVHLANKVAPIPGPFDVALGRDLAGGSFIHIADQLEITQTIIGQRSMNARVLFSQVAYTYYCGS